MTHNHNNTIPADYRLNILTDKNNPILLFKANRDRFAGGKYRRAEYWGRPCLSSPRSEDALTWNVIRSLAETDEGRAFLEGFFQVRGLREIMLWGFGLLERGETQFRLNAALRELDGRESGQMTEPDLVLVGSDRLLFVECKLAEPDKKPYQPFKGSGKRIEGIYAERLPRHFRMPMSKPDVEEHYQLIRNVLYANILGEELGLKPSVCALVNARNREAFSERHDRFRGKVLGGVLGPIRTWQEIRQKLPAGGPCGLLKAWMEQHGYL